MVLCYMVSYRLFMKETNLQILTFSNILELSGVFFCLFVCLFLIVLTNIGTWQGKKIKTM